MTLNSIIKNNIAIVSFIDTENKHQVKKVQIFKDNHLLLNRKSFKIGDEHLMEIMFLSKDSDDINKLKIKLFYPIGWYINILTILKVHIL